MDLTQIVANKINYDLFVINRMLTFAQGVNHFDLWVNLLLVSFCYCDGICDSYQCQNYFLVLNFYFYFDLVMHLYSTSNYCHYFTIVQYYDCYSTVHVTVQCLECGFYSQMAWLTVEVDSNLLKLYFQSFYDKVRVFQFKGQVFVNFGGFKVFVSFNVRKVGQDLHLFPSLKYSFFFSLITKHLFIKSLTLQMSNYQKKFTQKHFVLIQPH